MNTAVPNASVLPPPHSLVGLALPDPDDLHVVTAGQAAGCQTILTFNLKDFPLDQLANLDPPLSVTHPDTFLLALMTT